MQLAWLGHATVSPSSALEALQVIDQKLSSVNNQKIVAFFRELGVTDQDSIKVAQVSFAKRDFVIARVELPSFCHIGECVTVVFEISDRTLNASSLFFAGN